jgi:hypothetical protein
MSLALLSEHSEHMFYVDEFLLYGEVKFLCCVIFTEIILHIVFKF